MMNLNLSSEWLETNGIGGFSSLTISGINRRRYHGLLTDATRCVAQAWSVAALLRVMSDLEKTDHTDLNDEICEQVFSLQT